MSAPRSLLRLFETEEDDGAMYGLPTPQASNKAFSFPIRAGSAPPGTTAAFNEANNTANVNTIRLPSMEDDDDDEVSLNFNTDFAMGMDTMRPGQSSPPRTATTFKANENRQPSMSIKIPDVNDDDDNHSGFSWSFPSTPSGHGFGTAAQGSSGYGSNNGQQSVDDDDDLGTVRHAHGFNQHRKESSPVPFYTSNTAFAFPKSQTSSPMGRTLPLASPSGADLPPMSSPSASPPRIADRTASALHLSASSQAERDPPSRPGMLRLASVAVMERRGTDDQSISSHRSRLSSGSDSTKFRLGSFLSRPGSTNRADADRTHPTVIDASPPRSPGMDHGEGLRVSHAGRKESTAAGSSMLT
jgi:hypothetical protein